MSRKLCFSLAILFSGWLAFAGYAQNDPPNNNPNNLDWLTAQERAFLRQHSTIRISGTPHYPPFEYWEENDPNDPSDDEFCGVVSSYLEHFEKVLGIQFQLVRTKTWAESLQRLELRNIDAVGLLVPWSERDFAVVSKPYITYPAVLIVRKQMRAGNLSLKDFIGQKVAVPDNYTGEAFLRQNYPNIDVIEVADPVEGIRMLTSGDVDAFFEGAANVAFTAERAGITNLRVGGESDFLYRNGLGVRSDWPIFANIISKTLDRIPAGQKSAFHREWVTESFLEKQFYEYPRFWWILSSFALGLSMISVGMVVRNRRQAAFIEQLEAEKRRTDIARQQAEEANRAKGQFVAMISHEIRTPMTGVLGMCELLQMTKLDAKQKRYLNSASTSVESLVSLVNDILDFSKMEAGKLRLEEVPFSLTQTVDSVVTLMRSQAQKRGLKLLSGYDENLNATYLGDPGRIRQVLLNLIGNAIKFTTKGQVEVRVTKLATQHGRDQIEFEIEDTGRGIPADQLEMVFQLYEQSSDGPPGNICGTGLGLPICRTLAELMGGQASVTSTVGQGSQFRFSVLLAPSDQPSPLAAGESIVRVDQRLRRLRVLLAEDGIVNQKVAEGLLVNRGHTVDIVTTGVQAVEASQTGRYDIVLMDIELPELDGLGAAQKIRECESGTDRHLPIIAVTGHAMPEDRKRMIAAGMDGVLTKPYRGRDLYDIVEAHTSCSKRQEPDLESPGLLVLSQEAALAFTEGDVNLAQELLKVCLETLPDVLTQARAAAESADFVTVRDLAHSLRTSFGVVGAQLASRAAESLERCHADKAVDYLSRIDEIERQAEQVHQQRSS